MASPGGGGHLLLSSSLNNNNNDVKKCGYLRKQKHGHRRFFVLREAATDGGGVASSPRLEYYESEKKWRSKSAAKRVIALDQCLCVNKRADAKHRHLIALYTKDEYFAVAADSEPEQESWFAALSDLIAEGRARETPPASTSSLVGFEEASSSSSSTTMSSASTTSSYGVMMTPAAAAYKEVWQVNLKSKGLGQVKNLTGVYRLCLSSRTISFVKLNSEVAAVSLQLMNIRRCGHSDSFFFIEVGRSAVTGPGEFWMQAEDSVVAQNIHETILEAMKAMKELSEFRPRSKSQSASTTNPISVPTRRNLNNPPPSQIGLVRRSRTDSMAATSPGRKFTPSRYRTASEGDGCPVAAAGARPVSMSISVSSSPGSGGTHLIRSQTISSSGRTCRMLETNSNLQHSRSMTMSNNNNSPPTAFSPISLSPKGGATNIYTPDKARGGRPFSCSASISGSLGDAGFMLCAGDEYSSSPAGSDARFLSLTRSDTPDSLSSTPPSRDTADPCGYMMMDGGASSRHRKRTYSLTTPRPRAVVAAPLSSASLDEYTLMRAASGRLNSASPKVCYPEDYGDIEIGGTSASSARSSSSNLGAGDDSGGGYMPMTPGVAPSLSASSSKVDNYVPMSPMCVSAPKQIVNPRCHAQSPGGGGKTSSPGSGCGDTGSLEDSGYMRMWCGSKSSVESPDSRLGNGEYINMSPAALQTPPDYYYLGPLAHAAASSGGSLPRPAKNQLAPKSEEGDNQYVLMSPQRPRGGGESDDYYSVMQPSGSVATPSPVRHGAQGAGGGVAAPLASTYKGRLSRPNRLSLDTLRMLPSMTEHPLPSTGEPRSPGEYINIDFSSPPAASSAMSQPSLAGSCGRRSLLSDYMNLELGSPKEADSPASNADTLLPLPGLSSSSMCPCSEEEYHLDNGDSSQDEAKSGDYTEMTFGMAGSPQITACTHEALRERRPSLDEDQDAATIGVFLLGASSSASALAAAEPAVTKVIRAHPQGRRRHSSETFSSTATVTPVFPSFAGRSGGGSDHNAAAKRHSSVENISSRSSEGSDEECGGSGTSPTMSRRTSAGYQHGLNYIALNLLDVHHHHDDVLDKCAAAGGFKPTAAAGGCKRGIHGLHTGAPYVCLGFKEAATTAKD